MVSIIIISESLAAKEMLKTACKVLNRQNCEGVYTLVLDASEKMETRHKKLTLAVNKAKSDGDVLIMTELFGASQTNVCKQFFQKGKIEVLCGYNLPMIIEAVSLNQNTPISKLRELTLAIGQKYIRCPCCEGGNCA